MSYAIHSESFLRFFYRFHSAFISINGLIDCTQWQMSHNYNAMPPVLSLTDIAAHLSVPAVTKNTSNNGNICTGIRSVRTWVNETWLYLLLRQLLHWWYTSVISVQPSQRSSLSLSLSNILVGGIHQTWLVSTSRQISRDVNVNIKENIRCGLIDNCHNNQMSTIFKQTTIFVKNLLYVGYLKICNKF